MILAIAFALVALISGQGGISAEAHKDGPPDTLAPAIRASLSAGGPRAAVSDTRLDFWFVKALPVKGADGAWEPPWSRAAWTRRGFYSAG